MNAGSRARRVKLARICRCPDPAATERKGAEVNASERDSVLSAIVSAVAPGGRLVGSTAFPGGLSSEMILVEAERADGVRQQFVVRRARGERGSISMEVEYRLLRTLWTGGLPVPEPLFFDRLGAGFERPYMVLAYVDGSPRVTEEDGVETARRLAELLVAIHTIDGSAPELNELPRRDATVSRVLEQRTEGSADASMQEDRILEVLRAHWPPAPPARPSLLHCDLWLGNVLWSGSDVVAVIDWENAHVGDPLADLAITRLECAWSFGRDAVASLTEHFVARSGADLGGLALWDLAAARRPAGEVSAWAADWANYGRPDMTAARMRAAHRWFVDDALTALGEAD
jgi:aminoglycoside phosphotransferase (APT) family kinase protein